MNLISVIIPYYHKKKYILQTIKSVIKQTYKNLEIILIYDEENKDNLNFIINLCKIDKRIKLIVNKKNLGVSLSRNLGIKKSKGKYLAFIDADDLWAKHKLETQLNFMQKNNIKISHTSYKIINNLNHIIGQRTARNFTNINDLLKSCDIGLSTVLLKKSILENKLKFPNIKTKEDFVLWLKIISKKHKIYAIKKNLVKWRKLNNSLSSSSMQKLVDGFNVYYRYMNFNFIKSIFYLFCLSLNYLEKRFDD